MTFRIGGDEVILLLKNCPYSVARQKLRELFRAVKQAPPPTYAASISYGIVPVGRDNQFSYQELFYLCDNALYRFKRKYKGTSKN